LGFGERRLSYRLRYTCFNDDNNNDDDDDDDDAMVPGLRCEDDDACVSNPCRLGASCETLPANGSYQCVCELGWTGRDCDVDVDECALSK